jgi:2-polyprenyl-3-methyl-5-hydroxy-6-metoxy-1,4-benzoquinol methylase
MNHALAGEKRTAGLSLDQVQQGNASWWHAQPMDYDWHGTNRLTRGSREWFDWIDDRFVNAARLFATDMQPFDRIMPLDALVGRRVLDIGCGMGLHTETMARAGALVTAVDLTSTAVDMTRRRLALKGLRADLLVCDAEQLNFPDDSFDFVWSWGVIHHSARTGRVVRQIARVLRPGGECRVMVYNREGTGARIRLMVEHVIKLGFLRRSSEETLFRATDGFSARYYVKDQIEDLFRTFFEQVSAEICGQDADVLPLPRQLRAPLLHLIPESHQRRVQRRRGGFLFLKASSPV